MYKNQTAELLYNQMIAADSGEVCGASLRLLNSIQGLAVRNQLLGLACAVLCLCEVYDLRIEDVIGIGHQVLYCNDNITTMQRFKAVKEYMRDDWDIRYNGK